MKKIRVWCRKCGEGRGDEGWTDIEVTGFHKYPDGTLRARLRCGMCRHEWEAASGFENLRRYIEVKRAFDLKERG